MAEPSPSDPPLLPNQSPRASPAATSLLALPIKGRRQWLHLLHGWRLLPLVKLAFNLVLEFITHLKGVQEGLQLLRLPSPSDQPRSPPRGLPCTSSPENLTTAGSGG